MTNDKAIHVASRSQRLAIFAHPVFLDQVETLVRQVEDLRQKDRVGYVRKNVSKRLAAMAKLTFDVIPQDPTRTGRQPEPVNPLLGVLGRGSVDHAYYEAMFGRLLELQPLLDSAPQLLAAERVQAIIDALRKAGIDRNRLQSGGITEVTGGSNAEIASEFALEVMPGAS